MYLLYSHDGTSYHKPIDLKNSNIKKPRYFNSDKFGFFICQQEKKFSRYIHSSSKDNAAKIETLPLFLPEKNEIKNRSFLSHKMKRMCRKGKMFWLRTALIDPKKSHTTRHKRDTSKLSGMLTLSVTDHFFSFLPLSTFCRFW